MKRPKLKRFLIAIDGRSYGNLDSSVIHNLDYFVSRFNNEVRPGNYIPAKGVHQSDLPQNEITTYTPEQIEDMYNKPNKSRKLIKTICKKLMTNGEHWNVNKNNTVTVENNIWLDNLGLKRIPIKFSHCVFSCHLERNKLLTLENCPDSVGIDFNCQNNNLMSLDGCPKVVKGNFNCYSNPGHFTEEDVRSRCKVGGRVLTDFSIEEETNF